jgi:C4-dicarboxylate-specific signal transduction histidine kinase
MKKKGTVWINTTQNEDTPFITIADDGLPSLRNTMPRYLPPFSTKQGQNSGLGLSICHNIIKDDHGIVDIKKDSV